MEAPFDPLYYNTIDQIYHASWVAEKLSQFRVLQEAIGRLWPEGHPTRLIQVAGTSGKGSTVRYIEAGLGLEHPTGTLTSPHLFDYRERFSVNGRLPDRADIVRLWEQVLLPLNVDFSFRGPAYILSQPQIYILLALLLFQQHGIEWAAVETGLGGRYDQTTALDVEAAVLTNVGSDHQNLLGREQWQRVLDKSGVCRPNRPLFTTVQDRETLAIAEAVALHVGAPLQHITTEDVEVFKSELVKVYPDGPSPTSLLSSEHQFWNATLASKVIAYLKPELPMDRLLHRLGEVQLRGRFERIAEQTYIDVAHNREKIEALTSEVVKKFPTERKVFVVGVSGSRSPRDVLAPILQIAEAIIVTASPYKGIDPHSIREDLMEINSRNIAIEIFNDPREAWRQALAIRDTGAHIFITGSTYMIDQILNPDPYLRQINATYGWRTEGRLGTVTGP